MTNIISRIFIMLLPFIFISCSKDGCSLSSGELVNQTRNVASFNQIILYDKINLILKEDTVQTLTVSTNENLADGIKTDVSNNILTIKNENHCTMLTSPDQQVNVYISLSQLQQIIYYGAGNINSVNTLHSPQFTVDSWSGTGMVTIDIITHELSAFIRNNNAQLTFTGQSDLTSIYCADAGYINMYQLTSENVILNQRSVRDMYINVSGSLNADIVYKGNVFFTGNPLKIDSLMTSSGRLIHVQ